MLPIGIRKGTATIEVISNGFLLRHDYLNLTAKPTYFATLEEMFSFLKNHVFREVD